MCPEFARSSQELQAAARRSQEQATAGRSSQEQATRTNTNSTRPTQLPHRTRTHTLFYESRTATASCILYGQSQVSRGQHVSGTRVDLLSPSTWSLLTQLFGHVATQQQKFFDIFALDLTGP